MRNFRHFTSEQNKAIKIDAVEKVIPMTDFKMYADDTCRKL